MLSSDLPSVRGPIKPIDNITSSIAPAMKPNTPVTPASFSTNAIANELNTAESRLHE